MIEATKEIVVAMINNNQLPAYDDVDKNIEAVNKAIDAVFKQLVKISSGR